MGPYWHLVLNGFSRFDVIGLNYHEILKKKRAKACEILKKRSSSKKVRGPKFLHEMRGLKFTSEKMRGLKILLKRLKGPKNFCHF